MEGLLHVEQAQEVGVDRGVGGEEVGGEDERGGPGSLIVQCDEIKGTDTCQSQRRGCAGDSEQSESKQAGTRCGRGGRTRMEGARDESKLASTK